MRITVVYFVNVTCTYSSILVKWVSFISGYTNTVSYTHLTLPTKA